MRFVVLRFGCESAVSVPFALVCCLLVAVFGMGERFRLSVKKPMVLVMGSCAQIRVICGRGE